MTREKITFGDRLRVFGLGLRAAVGSRTVNFDNLETAIIALTDGTAGDGVNYPLNIGVVHRCVSLISDTISTFPLHYEKRVEAPEDGKPQWEKVNPWEDELALVIERPHPVYTGDILRAAIILNASLYGNGYAEVVRVGNRVIGLIHHRAKRVRLRQYTTDRNAGDWYYEVSPESPDHISSQPYHVEPTNMIHVKGSVLNAWTGYDKSVIFDVDYRITHEAARLVQEILTNADKLLGMISMKVASKERIKQLQDQLQDGTQAGGLRILVAGGEAEYKPVEAPGKDRNYNELRSENKKNIANIFGIPPAFVGDTNVSTAVGSGLEQQLNLLLHLTLRPYMKRLVTQFRDKLIPVERWGDYRFRHEVHSSEFADAASKTNLYGALMDRGVLDANEVRDAEGYSAFEGGDEKRVIGMGGDGVADPGEGGDNEDDDGDDGGSGGDGGGGSPPSPGF